MNIRILSEAQQDLIEGYHFYESQSPGLGSYFLDTLFSDIDSLLIFAGIHEVHFQKYFRMLSSRFPFAIYYTAVAGMISVHAVLDCRRDPAWIRKKL